MQLRAAKYWKTATIGMAIVVVTAVTTGLAVLQWAERAREVQPAALPAVVAELPPRSAGPASDDAGQTVARPAGTVVNVAPKAVADACDDEAARAAGATTLVTKKKMREIRKSEKYRAVYTNCVKEKGYPI